MHIPTLSFARGFLSGVRIIRANGPRLKHKVCIVDLTFVVALESATGQTGARGYAYHLPHQVTYAAIAVLLLCITGSLVSHLPKSCVLC